MGERVSGSGEGVPGNSGEEMPGFYDLLTAGNPGPGRPGNSGEEVLGLYERHLNPGLARVFRFLCLAAVEGRADGSLVFDEEGHRYLDCGSGYAVMNLGHRHPRLVAALLRQLELLPLSTRILLSRPQAELARLLAEVTPGELGFSFFCNSGAEAVEAALKLARLATGRLKVVAARGAFHGKTLGALSVTWNPAYREPFRLLFSGVEHVPYGDGEALEQAVGEDTAAVILEPVQGEAGVIIPPEDYLPRAREICSRRGALLILDEVQTGMGRTGRMFACEHWGVVPDLLCLAKGLGGGLLPVGAVVGTREVFRVFEDQPLIHTSTLGGNPLACAVAAEAVRVVREERLAEEAERKGRLALGRLRRLAARYPGVIREVRGMGLLIGIEARDGGVGGALLEAVLRRRVIVVPGLNEFRVIRFAPPLNIPDDLLEEALHLLEEAVEEVAPLAEALAGAE